MADPLSLIENHVHNGKDVVIGENHAVMDITLNLMAETIRRNPDSISAVSLEAPIEVQRVINKAAAGEIDENTFIKEARIAYDSASLSSAIELFDKGVLNADQAEQMREKYDGRINDIIKGTHDFYTVEDSLEDQRILGALHNLSLAGGETGIPILANDLDREYTIIRQFDDLLTLNTLHERFDDTSDHNLLSSQVDLDTAKPILVHRGVNHLLGVGGYRNGIDDTLEAAGRDVVTIAHHPSIENMISSLSGAFTVQSGLKAFFGIAASDNEITDPTDEVIIGNKTYNQSNVEVAKMGI